MRCILTAIALLLPIAASAAPGPQSYTTVPPGTIWGNPNPWADNPVPHSQAQVNAGYIAILKSAAMSVTTDQAMSMLVLPSKYQVTGINVTNCSTTPAGAVGGIYTATSKGGTAIVAGSQTYTALTSPTMIQALTDAVITTSQTAPQLYFSLTSAAASGTPTCDIYVTGVGLQ